MSADAMVDKALAVAAGIAFAEQRHEAWRAECGGNVANPPAWWGTAADMWPALGAISSASAPGEPPLTGWERKQTLAKVANEAARARWDELTGRP